jgi:general secretion pathway protein N
MRNTRRLILAGIFTFLIGLIITFPARVAYEWFAPAALRLSGISGSIWRGTATEGSVGGIYLTNLKWGFRPLGLATGKIEFATSSKLASGFIDANTGVSAGGSLTLSDVSGALTLDMLAGLLPLKGVQGDVSLQFEDVVIKNGVPVEAMGVVNIANLVSQSLSPMSLGDFRAEFQTAEDGVLGSVQALSGVLELAGSTIRLSESGDYEFAGRVLAKPSAPPALSRQLQFLGSPDADGFREFFFPGKL